MLVAVAAVRAFAVPRARFAGGSFADVERAVRGGGLSICSTVDRPAGQANGAVASRQYEIATDCAGGQTAKVVVDTFGTAAARDAAARNAEVQVRPTGNGVAYTFGRSTVFVFGPSDDRVQDRLNDVLRRAGAR